MRAWEQWVLYFCVHKQRSNLSCEWKIQMSSSERFVNFPLSGISLLSKGKHCFQDQVLFSRCKFYFYLINCGIARHEIIYPCLARPVVFFIKTGAILTRIRACERVQKLNEQESTHLIFLRTIRARLKFCKHFSIRMGLFNTPLLHN